MLLFSWVLAVGTAALLVVHRFKRTIYFLRTNAGANKTNHNHRLRSTNDVFLAYSLVAMADRHGSRFFVAFRPFRYYQIISLLRLPRAGNTDQRGGIAIMLRCSQSFGRISSPSLHPFDNPPDLHLGGNRCLSYLAKPQVPS